MHSYDVNDIVRKGKSKAKYIFVFESPHKTEIETNIPVSGTTGKYILNKFGLSKENFCNFGAYVLDKQNAAILNVSNSPLQKIKLDRRSYINNQNNIELKALFYGLGNIYLSDKYRDIDIITDRHLVSNYFWNSSDDNY